MTRERANDYEDKKQLIMSRAAALFARKGFELTAMIDVAKACNTSKSYLYHYFPAKEDLLFAIVSEHTQELIADASEIVALPLDAEERFSRFVTAFIEKAAESRNEHLVLVNDLKHLSRLQRKQIRDMETRLVRLMIDLLEEINPGLMKAEHVKGPYAMLIFGMLIWTFTWYKKSGEITPRELAARISHLFMHGFTEPLSA